MTKVGIVGFGSLGRAVATELQKDEDMELVGIFSRRDPDSVETELPVYALDSISEFKDQIDVLALCGGSHRDIPEQGPQLVRDFNTVDCFDTHAKIPEYFEAVNQAATETNHTAVISTGWDPGLFSLNRLLAETFLPVGETYTLWGKGVSQGHSNSVRRLDGVVDAVQYTVPNPEVLEALESGETIDTQDTPLHNREVYAVLEDGADEDEIRETIETLPNYFENDPTTVHFISLEELERDHSGLPHGGHVTRIAETGEHNRQRYQFSLDLGSNPEFTASIAIAYVRAVAALAKRGEHGAKTVFDIAPRDLSPLSDDELRHHYL